MHLIHILHGFTFLLAAVSCLSKFALSHLADALVGRSSAIAIVQSNLLRVSWVGRSILGIHVTILTLLQGRVHLHRNSNSAVTSKVEH